MGIYGYCVVPAGHRPPAGLTGIGGGDVAGHAIDGLAVWVSESERPEPTAEHVRDHNQVIEAAVTEVVTPVPLRFGQWAEGFGIFEETIRGKAAWYGERLTAFAGALEFGLRVARPDKPVAARVVRVPASSSGTDYLRALQANLAAVHGAQAEQERVRAAVAAAMGELVREERIEEARTPHGVVDIAHLVARPAIPAWREQVQRLRAELPELRFLASGPWVPYSFAS